MKLYKIYTENKNRDRIEDLVSQYYDGFTIFETTGYWKGVKENSLVIEILQTEPEGMYFNVRNLCKGIKINNNQESVLLTEQLIEANFI